MVIDTTIMYVLCLICIIPNHRNRQLFSKAPNQKCTARYVLDSQQTERTQRSI